MIAIGLFGLPTVGWSCNGNRMGDELMAGGAAGQLGSHQGCGGAARTHIRTSWSKNYLVRLRFGSKIIINDLRRHDPIKFMSEIT